MDHSRFRAVKDLFQLVRVLDPAERERELDRACVADPTLRAEIEDLLTHAAAADERFFETAPPTPIAGGTPALAIAGFQIHSVLGVGACGVVYRAMQLAPRREVALKVLRLDSMASGQVARFRREAEILAALRHPGIAQVHGAGVTDDGSLSIPWIAMELVLGIPIDEYVEARSLPWRAVAALIIDVCAAVEHAHARGIVHRDLKPSNVLVDDTGKPRILDFGVARAIAEPDAFDDIHTRTGALIGTLAYMAPEQTRGKRATLSPAADVFALGVITFELLTGRTPLAIDDLDLVEALRAIERDEPERLRHARPDAPLDLETIVVKALEKRPERRYLSAGSLANDLERLLANRPIAARRPTVAYQVSKFVRRNRAFTVGTAVVVAALSIGLALALSSLREVRAQREVTSETLGFLAGRLVKLAPRLGFGEEQRGDFEEVVRRLEAQITVEPDSRALHVALAATLYELATLDQLRGDHVALLAHALEAHGIRSRLVESDPADRESWVHLSSLCAKLGEASRDLGDPQARDEWFAHALRIDEQLVRDYPLDLELVEDLGWSLARIAHAASERSDDIEAERVCSRRLADAERLVELEPDVWKYVYNLSHVHCVLSDVRTRLGRTREARENSCECHRLALRLQELEPTRRDFTAWLANACRHAAHRETRYGDRARGRELFTEALDHADRLVVADPRRRSHVELLQHIANDAVNSSDPESRIEMARWAANALRHTATRIPRTGNDDAERALLAEADKLERAH